MTDGVGKDRHKRPQTNVRLSEEARNALQALAERDGDSASGVIERLIRDRAREVRLKVKGLDR
jgi:hypothetical protein